MKAAALVLLTILSISLQQKTGRLETMEEGNWVTSCSEGFTDDSAKTTCAQLGLEGGTATVVKSGTNKGRSTTGFTCPAGAKTTEKCDRKAWIDNFLAPANGNAGIPKDSAGNAYHTWQLNMGTYD
jgi:hypothetical protein